MKIRLLNFRCYEDKTFEFDDDGLVLISACSGAGKTTIFMAIQFVLFGIGTKVTRFGKTSCKVELEFQNFKIARTKRPNRVVLNDDVSEYEDDAAQEIINKKFGDTFNVTGYIPQNVLNSFIVMSPTDKLEFLEKFAFKGVNLAEIKNRCKSLITQRNDILKATNTQIETLEKVFEELKKPEEVKFPLKGKNTDYEKIAKNEEIRKKNCDILIKRSRNTIEKTQSELSDLRVLNAFLNNKTDNIDSITEKLKTLKIEEDKIIYEGDESLNSYKKKLSNILSQKQVLILEERYEIDKEKLKTMKDAEIEKLKNELQVLTDSLWVEYAKEELIETIKDTKDCLKDAKKVSFLKKELKDFSKVCNRKELEDKKLELENRRAELDTKRQLLDTLKKQSSIFTCPSCDNKLHFRENKLYLSADSKDLPEVDIDTVKKDITFLQNIIKKLEVEIPDNENKLKRKEKIENDIENIISQYEEIDEDTLIENLEYLEEYQRAQCIKEKRKTVIENNIFNNTFPAYESFEKDIIKLEKQIKNLKNDCDSDDDDEEYDEEELRNIINREENNKTLVEKLTSNKSKLENELSSFKKQTIQIKEKHIQKFGSIKEESELENLINLEKDNITQKEEEKEKHVLNLENIKKYYQYEEDKKKYDSWESKLNELRAKEKDDRNKHTAASLLKEKILEAESIAVANIIESINIHAQIYLDNFFIDNPIIVRLLSFKETKKVTKPQINIEIQYKDMECDLSTLSGGELSRVVLAFTLALNEMFNTPMLLLDESTASLDQEATTIVFESIKENYKGKLVLIVAHQTVNGIFDKVINLDIKV